MRWLSVYLAVVGVLNVLATIVLAVVVAVAARGRAKVLGAVGFGVIAFGGVIGSLSGVIVSVLASTTRESLVASVVVNLFSTLVFLVGLGLVVAALSAVSARQHPASAGPAPHPPGPTGAVTLPPRQAG